MNTNSNTITTNNLKTKLENNPLYNEDLYKEVSNLTTKELTERMDNLMLMSKLMLIESDMNILLYKMNELDISLDKYCN